MIQAASMFPQPRYVASTQSGLRVGFSVDNGTDSANVAILVEIEDA